MERISSVAPIYMIAINISLGGLFFGYTIGSYNPCLILLQYFDQWKTQSEISFNESIVSSALSCGMIIGSLISQYVLNIMKGYRRTFMLCDIISVLFTLLMTVSPGLSYQVMGRTFQGVASGISLTFQGFYIKEFSPEVISGKTGGLTQLFITIGILLGNVVGLQIPQDLQRLQKTNYNDTVTYKLILGIPIIICLTRYVALRYVFQFDVPSLMYKKNEEQRIKDFILQAYHAQYHKEIKEELDLKYSQFKQDENSLQNQLQSSSSSSQEQNNGKKSLRNLMGNRIYKKKFLLGLIMAFGCQACGITAVMQYSNDIFREANQAENASIYTALIGLFQVIATFVGTSLLQKLGRRSLYVKGYSIVIVSLVIIIIALQTKIFWLELFSILLYIVGFSISLGLVYWVYAADILDDMGLKYSGMMGNVMAFIIGIVFKYMVDNLGIVGSFTIFIIVSLACYIYVLKYMVETKGKSSEEIDKGFEGKQEEKQIIKSQNQVHHKFEMEL